MSRKMSENGKQLKEELRILLNIYGDEIKQEIKLFNTRCKVDWAWFFDNNKKAILIEDKEKNDNTDENAQMEKYIEICRDNGVEDIISLIVRQNDDNSLTTTIKHNNDILDNSIKELSYYKNLLGVESVIDPSEIYTLTNCINELLHNENAFNITHLQDRMIFTGCLLLESLHGNLNINNVSTINALKLQVINTLKDLNQPYVAEKENKLTHLINQFKNIPIGVGSVTTQNIKSLVSYILQIKSIIKSAADFYSVDIMNIFFNEFGRKKGKTEHGQVFTPDHIATLMAKLIKAKDDDKILDPTCGSGALLVKSMFLATKNNTPANRKKFFTKNVFGIENSPQIVSLCYINMLLHQDGITNIRPINALSNEAGEWIKLQQINKVVSNPPYEKSNKPIEIMEKVMNNMKVDGLACFLLPSGKLRTEVKKVKTKLLSRHSLIAIIKLPDIFRGIAGVGLTSLFIFKNGTPQDYSIKAYGINIKDDGFVTGSKYKNQGRVDDKHIWEDVQCKCVNAVLNRDLSAETAKEIDLNNELEYIEEIPFEITEDDFKKTIVQRYLFEHPEIAKYFKITEKSKI